MKRPGGRGRERSIGAASERCRLRRERPHGRSLDEEAKIPRRRNYAALRICSIAAWVRVCSGARLSLTNSMVIAPRSRE